MVVAQGQHYSTVQYNVGEKPTVILYTSIINHHAGTGQQTKQEETKNTMNLDTAQFSSIGLGSDSCQYFHTRYVLYCHIFSHQMFLLRAILNESDHFEIP